MNIIALLTDFGLRDYYVGAMKGVILSIHENARIVDITHQIPPQDVAAAGFTLRACYRNFPRRTAFVAVVDPGVGSGRRAILVETNDYFFIGPDNGLFSFVFNEAEEFRVFELTNRKFFSAGVSRTFHGRDIFAPVAAHLSRGTDPREFGAEISDFVFREESAPRRGPDGSVEAEVIYVDHFGNLVTNLRSEDLPERFALEIGGLVIKKRCRFYAEAEEGEIFSISGSAGFLEISARNDSAARLLDVDANSAVRLIAVR